MFWSSVQWPTLRLSPGQRDQMFGMDLHITIALSRVNVKATTSNRNSIISHISTMESPSQRPPCPPMSARRSDTYNKHDVSSVVVCALLNCYTKCCRDKFGIFPSCRLCHSLLLHDRAYHDYGRLCVFSWIVFIIVILRDTTSVISNEPWPSS